MIDERIGVELSDFPVGDVNPASEYFSGDTYLKVLTNEQVPCFNVTFAPGCRNNWHIHHASKDGGQMLIVVFGHGWYQEEGKPARELHAGDVVRVQMRQHDEVEIFCPQAAFFQLLMDGGSGGQNRMIEVHQVAGEEFRGGLSVKNAVRAYPAAPAGIHKEKTVRVLDQITADGKRNALPVRIKELPACVQQVNFIAVRHAFGNRYGPAVQNMYLYFTHGFSSLANKPLRLSPYSVYRFITAERKSQREGRAAPAWEAACRGSEPGNRICSCLLTGGGI